MHEAITLRAMGNPGRSAAAAPIGFGTQSGTVAAASHWDGEMEVKKARPALEDSVERCFHLSGRQCGMMDFARHAGLSEELAIARLERFIGVICRPETGRFSHYAEASQSRQFGVRVWSMTPKP